jgi:hypothetical protein
MTQVKTNKKLMIAVFIVLILFILLLVLLFSSDSKLILSGENNVNLFLVSQQLQQPNDNSFKSPALLLNYSAQKTIEKPAVNVPPIDIPATNHTYTFNIKINNIQNLFISITMTDNIKGTTTTLVECPTRPYTISMTKTKSEFYYTINIKPPDVQWPLLNCKPFLYCGSASSSECYDYNLIYRPKEDTITLRYTGGNPANDPIIGDYILKRSEPLVPLTSLSSNVINNPYAKTCLLTLNNNSTLTVALKLQQTIPNPTSVGSAWEYTERDLVYLCRNVPYRVGVAGFLDINSDLKNNSLLLGIDLRLGSITKINDTQYKVKFEYSGTGPNYGSFIVSDIVPPIISYTKHINIPNKPEYWKKGKDWKRESCQTTASTENNKCPTFDDGFGGNFPNSKQLSAHTCDKSACSTFGGYFNLCSLDSGVACRLGMSTTLPFSDVEKIGETVYSTQKTNYTYNDETNCDLNPPNMTCKWALPDPETTQSIPTELIDALRLYDGPIATSDGQYSSYMTDYCFAKVTEGCPVGQDICPRYFQEKLENTKAPIQVCNEWREKYPETWNTNVTEFCTTTSNGNFKLDACGCNGATIPKSKWYDVRQALEYIPGKGDQCWFGPCREQQTQLLTTTQLDTSGCGELSCANITVIANSTITDSDIKQVTSCSCTVDPKVGGKCDSGPGPGPGPSPNDTKSSISKWVWISIGSLVGLGLLIWLIWYIVKKNKLKNMSSGNISKNTQPLVSKNQTL